MLVMICICIVGIVVIVREELQQQRQKPPKAETTGAVLAGERHHVLVEIITIDGSEYVVASSYHGLAICPKSPKVQ